MGVVSKNPYFENLYLSIMKQVVLNIPDNKYLSFINIADHSCNLYITKTINFDQKFTSLWTAQ